MKISFISQGLDLKGVTSCEKILHKRITVELKDPLHPFSYDKSTNEQKNRSEQKAVELTGAGLKVSKDYIDSLAEKIRYASDYRLPNP